MQKSPRLMAFLEAMETADPQALVSPPGLGGLWRMSHFHSGLRRGVIVIHSTGEGFAFVIPKGHGVCPQCAAAKQTRTFCEHCNCTLCIWEREAAERSSPLVPREKVVLLAARFRAMQLTGPRPAREAGLVD